MRLRTILLAAGMAAIETAAASAADVSAVGLSPWAKSNSTISVDCADFQKQPGGAWKILRARHVGIGNADHNTAGGGYLVSGLTQSDGPNIYGAVDRACRTGGPGQRAP